MADRRLSAHWLSDFAVQLAHCQDGMELQAVGEAIHTCHQLTEQDRETLRRLYERAVGRLGKQ